MLKEKSKQKSLSPSSCRKKKKKKKSPFKTQESYLWIMKRSKNISLSPLGCPSYISFGFSKEVKICLHHYQASPKI